jgi:DNA-directed RNA polymerase specialized sigma24 family protein
MSTEGSVTHWLGAIKNGEAVAAQKLWEAYFRRLVALARQRLGNTLRRAADEEDVALSALNSFFQGIAHGRFPQLNDRDDLWRLLVHITARKAIDQINRERRKRRRPNSVVQVWADADLDSSEGQGGLAQIVGNEPTPEFAALVTEEMERLLQSLGSPELRSVAVWKMDGYSNAEIALKLDCVERSVERKLNLIRIRWSREITS